MNRIEKLAFDFHFGLRNLIRYPKYTSIVLFTMLLGIGATTTMFSLINQIILQPLPLPQAHELVTVRSQNVHTKEISGMQSIDYSTYQQWQDLLQTELSSAFMVLESSVLTHLQTPLYVTSLMMSPSSLPLLGVQPALGRWFREDEAGKNVVIVTHDLWQQEFASDKSIVGKSIMIDKKPFDVVGVMPKNFAKPIILTGRLLRPINDFNRPGRVIARVKQSLSPAKVRRHSFAMTRIMQQKKTNAEVVFTGLQQEILEPVVSNLWLLMVGVAALLLVAVLNVINLTFAHLNSRLQELAMRVSLGATRSRLIQQLLIETLILAVVVALGSVLLTVWLLDLALVLMPDSLPRREEIHLDLNTWFFSLLLATVSAFISSLIPGFNIVNPRKLIDSIKQGGTRSAGSFGGIRTRRMLIIIEVSFALVLLVVVGLLLRSYMKVMQQDPGFNPEQVVTGHVWAPKSYSQDQRQRYFQNVLTEIQKLPEIDHAGATSTVPIGPIATKVDFTTAYSYKGQPDLPDDVQSRAYLRTVSDDYFRVLEIPLISGRFFDEREKGSNSPSIILNNLLAETIWPGENVIGKRIHLPKRGEEGWFTIVGVVSNNYHDALDKAIKPEMFLSMSHSVFGGSTIVAKLKMQNINQTNMNQTMVAMSQAVLRVDNSVPMIQLHSMDNLLLDSLSRQKSILWILLSFALTTVALAGIGIYGLSNYLIGQRTSEIAVRMAIGASPRRIKLWVLKDAIIPVFWGIAFGLVAALLLSKLVSSLLYGVQTFDILAYLGAIVLTSLVGLLAPINPVLRAGRVKPSAALNDA